jgi:hypothetical protein
MSIDEISNAEMRQMAGIFETKWVRMVDDLTKAEQELEAERITLSILRQDCEYWKARALKAELNADKHWAETDFLMQQLKKVDAISVETHRMIERGILPAHQELARIS